jgi:hypothetical protein
MKTRWKEVFVPSAGAVLMAGCLAISAFYYARLHNQGSVGLAFVDFPQIQRKSPQGQNNKPPLTVYGVAMRPGAVTAVAAGGPAARAGIVPDDQVLAINDIPIADTGRLAQLEKTARRGDTISYRLRRGEDEYTVALRRESPLLEAVWLNRMVADVLVGLLYLFVGWLIFWKKRGDRRAVIFYWISMISAVSFLNAPIIVESIYAGGLGQTFHRLDLRNALPLVPSIPVFMLPPLLLHLALVFPKAHRWLQKYPALTHWVYWFPFFLVFVLVSMPPLMIAGMTFHRYSVPILAAVAALWIGWLLAVRARYRRTEPRPGWIAWCIQHPFATLLSLALASWMMLAAVGVFSPGIVRAGLSALWVLLFVVPFVVLATMGYPVATCWTLYSSYRASGIEEKRQLQWPLWGITVSIGGKILLSLISVGLLIIFGAKVMTVGPVTAIHDILPAVVAALIPLSFAVAILKYRLMEIDLLIKRTVLYSVLTGIVVCLYLGMVGGLGSLLAHFTGMKSQAVAVLATVVVAAVFLPIRTRVQGMMERRFFRKRQDYPQVLKRLREQMPEAVHLRALANLAVENAQQAVQSRTAVFFLKDDAGFLRCAAKVGLPDEALDGLGFREKSAVVTTTMHGPCEPGARSWSEEDELLLRRAVSALLVPVCFKSDLLGMMSLGPKLSGEDYDADDREFLTTLAYQAGVSIENQRLGEQERDFERAREIQEALLPKQIPRLAGYSIAGAWQPARSVSGDYYDVFPVGERKLVLCIADVSGKGLPAALLMSNLQAAVRTLATASIEPKQLCETVNRVIHGNVVTGRFITFFYCLLDADTRRLTYTNAGHNPPLVMRKNGAVERLQEGGLVLGILGDSKFAQGEVTLAAGDRLLLFTDGVSEAANTDQQEFGEERLADALRTAPDESAEAVQQYVMSQVTDFCANRFHDDASVLAVVVTA